MNQNTVLQFIQSKYTSKEMFADKRTEVQKISALLTQYSQIINKLSIDDFNILYDYKIFLEDLRLKNIGQKIRVSKPYQDPNSFEDSFNESFEDFPIYTPVGQQEKTPQMIPFIPSPTFKGSKQGYVFKNDYNGVGYYLDKRRTY